MPSTRKKKDTHEPVIMLSYKDLVRHTEGKPRQQVKKGDPEWEDGIKCIEAYHSQATVLSWAGQEEVRDIIQRLDYVITPSAKDTPSSHKLMIAHKRNMQLWTPPLWPVFIILKTLYGSALPREYTEYIRMAFGRTEIKDYTHEYFALDGAEPAEPATTEEDQQTSPWEDEVLDDKPEVSKETKKRDPSALDIEDGSSSANKRAKVAGAESLSLLVAETDNENRRDSMAVQVQLSNAVSERQTAEGVGCGCTIGNLRQMIDKKFETMQDALDKKIEEKFAAVREDLERKETEKFEAQTNELQAVMREAVKFHGEALTRLAELAWQRPIAPQGADV